MIKIFRDTPSLDEIFPNAPKDREAFASGIGLCYAPEMGDVAYTRADFLELVNGNEALAQKLFDVVTWEHPETILDQNGDTGEDEFPGIGDYLERSYL